MKKMLAMSAVGVLLAGRTAGYTKAIKYPRHEQTQEQLTQIRENAKYLKIGMSGEDVIDLIGLPQRKLYMTLTGKVERIYTSHNAFFEWATTGVHGFGKEIILNFKDEKLVCFRQSSFSSLVRFFWRKTL